MTNNALVRWSVDGQVGVIRMEDVQRENMMTAELVDGVIAAHDQLVAGGATVGVLAASGPVFCSGRDRNAGPRPPGVAPPGARLIETMETSPLLWLAAVDAPVLGVGIHLMTCCPLAIMGDAAWLGTPDVRQYDFYPARLLEELTELIGPRRVSRLALLGDPIPAAEALAMGLVERVVPAGRAEDAAQAEAAQLASLSSKVRESARTAWRARYGSRSVE